MQWSISAAALAVAASAVTFTVWTWREHRNADLVQIGVNVLRVDPGKEKEISAATRKWALDLIDANAGGVTFSPVARAQLLKNRFNYPDVRWGHVTWGSGDAISNNPVQPSR